MDNVTIISLTEDLEFVLRAMPNPKEKGYVSDLVTSLHVEDGQFVATDGRRLHFTKNFLADSMGVPDGNYTVMSIDKKNKKVFLEKNDKQFVNWKRIPAAEYGSTMKVLQGDDTEVWVLTILKTFPHKVSIKYLEAIPLKDGRTEWTVAQEKDDDEGRKPLTFCSDRVVAIVAGMGLDFSKTVSQAEAPLTFFDVVKEKEEKEVETVQNS
jgi:hypothetical protein